MGDNLALLTRLLDFRAQDIPVSVPKYLAQLTANTSGCFVLLFCDCCWVFCLCFLFVFLDGVYVDILEPILQNQLASNSKMCLPLSPDVLFS